MKTSEIKQNVIELLQTQTEEGVFLDIAPLDIQKGYVLNFNTFENNYLRPEDAKADVVEVGFDVVCFSFNSRNESDYLLDDLTEKIDGKCNDYFFLIKNTGVTCIEYEEEMGVFVSVANFTIMAKTNDI